MKRPELAVYDGQSVIVADLPLPQGLAADDPSLLGSVAAFSGETTTLANDVVVNALPDFEFYYFTGSMQQLSILQSFVVDTSTLTFVTVPEPSAFAQLVVGALATAGFARRRSAA